MISDSKNFNPSIKTAFKATLLASMIALSACGGGGSDGFYGGGSSGNSGTDGNTDTGGTTTAAVNIGSLELFDVNGTSTRTVTVAGATAKVKVTDAAGKGISGALVTFSGTGVDFGTSNGAVLSNADGEASISVKPTDANATGSYQLSATANYNDNTATTAAYNFSLQAANIILADMIATTTSLESGASTNITLKTQDADTGANQNNVSVNFSTSCGTFDNTTVVSSNQGDVTTTYKAIDANGKLCEGTQTITATGSDTSITKSIQVEIAGVTASALVYTNADSVNMATRNSGSSASGQIEFTVYANGIPAANQAVKISKTYAPTDFRFITLNNQSDQIVKSDSQGKVSVTLYPGNIPGPIEIKATLVNDPTISALSKNVSVVNSRATQNGVTITIEKNVLLNNTADTSSITMRLTNRNGTNIPAGTVVNFVAEGGKIDPNCSTNNNGTCTVTFTSQQPRPSNGRVTVIAYLEGDKQYIDVNGDNNYTADTDTLVRNIGDFFRDDDENNTYNANAGEFIYKRGATGICTNNSAVGVSQISSMFNDFLSFFRQPNIDNTCSTELNATLRTQTIFGFADDTPTFFGLDTAIKSGGSFEMYGNGLKTLSMPSGTTIGIEADDKSDTNNLTCEPKLTQQSSPTSLESVGTSFTIPALVDLSIVNSSGNYFAGSPVVSYGLRLKGCDTTKDVVRLKVTAPNGAVTQIENGN